jgi:hypothetical protein
VYTAGLSAAAACAAAALAFAIVNVITPASKTGPASNNCLSMLRSFKQKFSIAETRVEIQADLFGNGRPR